MSKRGRDKKRDKRKRKEKKRGPKDAQIRKAPTTNGRLIQDLMTSRQVKGSFKDYVIIAGNRMIDWVESWDVFTPSGDPLGIEGVVLIHKSKLDTVIDSKFAEKFWHPKHGRVAPRQAIRNPNEARGVDGIG